MANEFFKNFPEITYKLNDGRIVFIKDFFRKSTIAESGLDSLIDYTMYECQEGDRPDVVADKLYGNSDLHWTFFLVNEITNYEEWYKDNEVFENYMSEKYEGQYLISSASTDIVSSSGKFLLGEQLTTHYTELQAIKTELDKGAFSSANPSGKTDGQVQDLLAQREALLAVRKLGHVIQVDPLFNRIGIVGDRFATSDVITGSKSTKSFTVSSAVERRDGISHYKNGDGVKKYTNESGYEPVTFYTEELNLNENKRLIKVIRPEFINRVVNEFERVMK